MKIHDESHWLECDECERTFKRKYKLTSQEKTIHKCVSMAVDLVETLKEDDEKYSCTLCKNAFQGQTDAMI